MQAMLRAALEAAEKLAAEGIELEVIDPRTLVPFDVAAVVDSVKRTNRLLICHEAVERGGWAAEIAMRIMEEAFDYLDAPIVRLCGANVPIPYSASLESAVLPGVDSLMAASRNLVHGVNAPVGRG